MSVRVARGSPFYIQRRRSIAANAADCLSAHRGFESHRLRHIEENKGESTCLFIIGAEEEVSQHQSRGGEKRYRRPMLVGCAQYPLVLLCTGG